MVRVVIPDEIICPACNFCSNSSRTILIIKLFMPSDIAIWPTTFVAFEPKYNLFVAHRFHTRESFRLDGIEERMISNFHINHAKIIFFLSVPVYFHFGYRTIVQIFDGSLSISQFNLWRHKFMIVHFYSLVWWNWKPNSVQVVVIICEFIFSLFTRIHLVKMYFNSTWFE